MPGKKLIKNNTSIELDLVLIIRKGDLPEDKFGTTNLTLEPGQAQVVTYGDDLSIFLNGIEITGKEDGKSVSTKMITIERGSPLDNTLNTNNSIEIDGTIGNFTVQGYQSFYAGDQTGTVLPS